MKSKPNPKSKWKLTLRATMTTILLTLVILTVAAISINSNSNARFAADDFSKQILEQTSALVDAQINRLMVTATDQVRINQRLLKADHFDIHDFPSMARYWVEILPVRRLTRMSLALEENGEWVYVRRQLDGTLVIGELRRDPESARLVLRDYLPADYPSKPFATRADRGADDPRKQSWYEKAKTTGRDDWSDTEVQFDAEGEWGVPGVTCASPIFDSRGKLLGVMATTFDTIEISTYLRTLKVGDQGAAFVVEFREDGSRRVIAHPGHKLPSRKGKIQGSDSKALADVSSDRRIPAFLRHLPAELSLTNLQGTQRLQFTEDGIGYVGTYHCLSTRETPDWLICTVIPELEIFGRVERNHRQTLMIGLVILLLAIISGSWVATQVARPLERLDRETQSIGRLRFDADPPIRSVVLEVDRLATTIEETKTSLRSFQKYVPSDLVRLLHATAQEATLGGELRRMTIYFCDLANFTTISEQLPPEELVQQLSEYFGCLSEEIIASGGTVDKYIGDAIMAFWGAPIPSTSHATAACLTALKNQAAFKKLRTRWSVEGKPMLSARIGLHTGEVIVGNIGSPARLNYTVMGDPVNVASRLEGLNKLYQTEILVGEPTYLEARSRVVARPVDRVSVKGKTEGLLVFELVGIRGEVSPEVEDLVDLATRGFEHYQARDWERAIPLFEEVLRIRPGDAPSRILVERSRAFLDDPPVEAWDGVHHLMSK